MLGVDRSLRPFLSPTCSFPRVRAREFLPIREGVFVEGELDRPGQVVGGAESDFEHFSCGRSKDTAETERARGEGSAEHPANGPCSKSPSLSDCSEELSFEF